MCSRENPADSPQPQFPGASAALCSQGGSHNLATKNRFPGPLGGSTRHVDKCNIVVPYLGFNLNYQIYN